MPKYVCCKCNHEFWGWGVTYRYRSGSMLVCPDCEGELLEVKVKAPVEVPVIVDETTAA